jgi:regulator of sigma E protease
MIRVLMLFLSLTILVTLHELGHYLPARWFDTKVKKFYLFFDFLFPFSTALPYSLIRVLYDQPANGVEFFKNKAAITFRRTSNSKTDTEYGIGYFPLGGYVQIAGMVDESQDSTDLAAEPQPWEFRSKKAWQRLIIMVGGVFVNFVLGVFIFAMMLWQFGKEYLPTSEVKYGIYADSTAQIVGFKTGDHIVSVGGKPFEKFNSRGIIRDMVINNADFAEVKRNGELQTIKLNKVENLASNDSKDIIFVEPRLPIEIMDVDKDFPAAAAGLKKDDKIIAINTQSITYHDELIDFVKNKPNTAFELSVLRNQRDTMKMTVTTNQNAKLGIFNYGMDKFYKTQREDFSLLASFPQGFSDGVGFLSDQVKAFKKMFTGDLNPNKTMGGIGSMAKMFPDTWDWEAFWRMTAILSFVLAFMNLLPIPGLDGGYVIFLLWEMATGKKPNEAIVEKATSFGLLLLIGLMLYANGLDVVRAFFK